jgi:CRISPR-associated protein Cmr2
MTYTAVTFAPVQSFIRASRKLRDLYGSSLLLSHLARAIAEDAKGRDLTVISPADVDSSRGVPNVLVIEGDYRKGHAREALLASWKRVLGECRRWLEKALDGSEIAPADGVESWGASWRACGLHSWELFHGQGSTITKAREALAVNKQQRDWSVPNWTGESSTLSSAEAVVWPGMGAVRDPRQVTAGEISTKARKFLNELCQQPKLGEAFAGEKEEISLTELVKRLVTYPDVAAEAFGPGSSHSVPTSELIPTRIQLTSTRGEKNDVPESIVWFMADGDGVGDYLEALAVREDDDGIKQGERQALISFSKAMRNWAAALYQRVPAVMQNQAMVVYAGGDDLFGALHETEPGAHDLNTDHLWRWLGKFPKIWEQCGQTNLTVSMGLVWADAKVPQREALQHAREAEASAKARGKNRFALRLLYASGSHLEWTCPWEWLDPILSHYTDREGRSLKSSRDGRPPSWRHLAEDLQWLQSRQAIAADRTSARAATGGPAKPHPVSEALLQAYFPGWKPPRQPEEGEGRTIDQWLLDLGRVMAGLEKHRPKTARGDQR